jgi:glycine oxidase ThiO
VTDRHRSATDSDAAADLVVLGGGLIGLAIAAAASERGLSVVLVTSARRGAASRAGAGLLVPHYGGEGARGAVERFLTQSRDLYPEFVRSIEDRSGMRVPFWTTGALEFARSEADASALQLAAPPDAEAVDARTVAALEPGLGPTSGGVLYRRDGAVDNVKLTDALSSVVERDPRVRTVRDVATRLTSNHGSITVTGATGSRVRGDHVVLAAGAWTATIDGLPRDVPVRPLRGQLCTLGTAPLRHVVLGPDVYMVTRGEDRTLVGSTMEDVGFDPRTTNAAIDGLRLAAATACPSLAGQPVLEAWAGLRPATPDLLPILGPDPDDPRLLYACGHSRNGILLAPITAAVIAAIAAGTHPGWDIAPFGVKRFAGASAEANHRLGN